MSDTESAGMLNIEFLKSKINEKFQGVEAFARTIGVSRQSVYDWLKKVSSPESSRLLAVADALDLSETEMETLLGLPQTVVYFRKRGLASPAEEIVARSRDLAETFFKIDSASYVIRDNTLLGATEPDVSAVATYVRKLLSLEADEPVRLPELLLELRKHNVTIFFLPFARLGLSYSSGTNREVAFSAKKGRRIIIFVDTCRTEDEALFDICHELAHLILRHESGSDEQEEERFCNRVAQELIYPARFLQLKKSELSVFTDTQKYSWHAVIAAFNAIDRELNWSPMGLALALEKSGLIAKDSHAQRRLMHLGKVKAPKRRTIDSLLFGKFLPNDYGTLSDFFENELDKQPEVFRPFVELKDAAAFGKISSRRIAEILNIDTGDADELVQSWVAQQEQLEGQDDANVSTG